MKCRVRNNGTADYTLPIDGSGCWPVVPPGSAILVDEEYQLRLSKLSQMQGVLEEGLISLEIEVEPSDDATPAEALPPSAPAEVLLVDQSQDTPDPKVASKAVSPKPPSGSLIGFSVKTSGPVIDAERDPEVLRAWLAAEERVGVIEKLNKRLAELEELALEIEG